MIPDNPDSNYQIIIYFLGIIIILLWQEIKRLREKYNDPDWEEKF